LSSPEDRILRYNKNLLFFTFYYIICNSSPERHCRKSSSIYTLTFNFETVLSVSVLWWQFLHCFFMVPRSFCSQLVKKFNNFTIRWSTVLYLSLENLTSIRIQYSGWLLLNMLDTLLRSLAVVMMYISK